MCKCASFVVTKGPTVWWLPKSDSHEDIISEYKLNADGVGGPNIVRVEISPDGENLSLPLNTWNYEVDQPEVPEWYDKVECEKAARLALKDWAQAKLNGWKVEEAFNPINPLKLKTKRIPKAKLLKLLKEVASVRASVGASVGASVWDSVMASVWDSVRASVRASVRDSTGASVWDSVRDSVWAYISCSFPKIKNWKYIDKRKAPFNKIKGNPFRSAIKLWKMGLVPSYDSYNKVWRLHGGPKAEIMFEIKKSELEKL